MIHHHPSDLTLVAHAAGTLPALHARVLRVHLAACPPCRAQLQELEEIGGTLFAAMLPAKLHPDALARTLARLGDATAAAPPEEPAASSLTVLATGHWWWLRPGVRLMPLVRRDRTGTRLDLIRVAPGVTLPRHGHSGPEMTCILQGGYDDETGHYALHDIAEGGAALRHTPVAAPGPDCICLIATTGRLRASTWLARMVQPLIDV